MKRLLSIPFLIVLLVACEPTPIESSPEEGVSTGTVESALCGCGEGQAVQYYGCNNDATSICGQCNPYNFAQCVTIPSSGNYLPCGSQCASGFYVTIYYPPGTFTCSSSGAPIGSVGCYKPPQGEPYFEVCGTTCPSGYSTTTLYNSNCNLVCKSGGSCSDNTHNAVQCRIIE